MTITHTLRPLTGLALIGTALACASAHAHHAFAAEYDAAQPLETQGEVTKVKWVNPHSWLYLDVKAKDGSVSTWGFEFGAPLSLQQKGLDRKALPAGTVVTVHGFKSKSGEAYGYASTVTLPDGRTIPVGGAVDQPKTAADTPAPR
jgi:hypothetical protein